jgi:hypothetical protein
MEARGSKMEDGFAIKRACFFARVWSSSFSLLLWIGWECAWADQPVLSPLKPIELPFPPGERSMEQLQVGDAVASVVVGWTSGIKTHSFSVDREGKLSVGKMAPPARPIDPAEVAGLRPKEPQGRQISRAIVADADGRFHTAGKDGFLFRWASATTKAEQLTARLPAVQGREPWASLDAAVLGPDGLIYGGTFDGYIFTFNPKTLEVINYGKPLRQQRVQGLAFSKGKLYGIGGEPDGFPRAFAFDPQTKSFQLGGTLKFGPGTYDMIMEPVGAMVADKDGNIYIGTTGRLGNLYVWEVGK